MTDYRLSDWIPTTKKEVELRGWMNLMLSCSLETLM